MTPRTKQVLDFYKTHHKKQGVWPTIKEIAQGTGISRSTINDIVRKESLTVRPDLAPTKPKEADMPRKTKAELSTEARLEAQIRGLQQEVRRLNSSKGTLQDVLQATEKAYEQALYITKRKPKIHKITLGPNKNYSQATAVALLSDVHCEEVVRPAKVNYLNEHNPDISLRRVKRFFELVVKFIRIHRQQSDIDNLVLWLGGDFITHSDSHGTPTAMDEGQAIIFAQDMIVSGLRFIAENEPNLNVRVVCSVGNHTRGNHSKPVNVAREQEKSLEWIMYHGLKVAFMDNPNIEFQIDNSYHSYVQVYKKVIRFNHGHLYFRYNKGLAGVHGPLWKVISEVWDNQINADLTCIGHYHMWTPAALSRPYMVNGSTIGINPYGLGFGEEEPAQMFFLVHPKHGFIEQTQILVNH